MFGASAPASGFGKAPATFGTTTNTATGAFGAPATASAGTAPAFGASSGFGTGATSGFGAKPASGFNVTSTATNTTTSAFGGGTGGFGTSTGGFGVPQQASNTTQGFGFGVQPQQQQQQPMMAAAPPQPPTVTLQDFTRQSALASYLLQLDQSYNALHPQCHFTAFVYNSCGPGQMMDAIQKERYTAYLNGGGCSDEAYMRALHKNPDPGRLYPSPLHFSQELLRRTEKQREAVALLQRRVDELIEDVAAVAAMDAANVQRQREVEQEEEMLRHRWYALLRKMELLRRQGSANGEEGLLQSRVEQLRRQLRLPGHYGQLLHELRPYLGEEMSRVAMMAQQCANSSSATAAGQRSSSPAPAAGRVSGGSSAWRSASGRPLLRSEVDPYIMKDWIQFAQQMQEGIETLDELLKTDLKEMRAIRERLEAA